MVLCEDLGVVRMDILLPPVLKGKNRLVLCVLSKTLKEEHSIAVILTKYTSYQSPKGL